MTTGTIITLIICITLVVLGSIAAFTVYECRCTEQEGSKPKNAHADSDPQQQLATQLMERLLDFQKELTYPYSKDKDKEGKPVKKDYDRKECDTYRQLLYRLMTALESQPLKGDTEIGHLLGANAAKPEKSQKPTT